MRRLLLLTPSELTRDPRARRAAAAAERLGLEVVGLSGQASGERPTELPGVRVLRAGRPRLVDSRRDLAGGAASGNPVAREARGVYRLVRLAWRTAALVRAGRCAGHVDIVHANDVDTLPAGWLLARKHRARLVYDAHELYAEFEADPPRFYRAVMTAVERALAGRAAAVVTVSGALADELHRRLHLRTKPLVVLNAPPPVAVDVQAHDGPLRAVYTGVFGSGRRLDDLLAAINAAPSAQLTIYALQQDPGDLRLAVSRHGMFDRVSVAEALPPQEVVPAISAFDVGVIFDSPVTKNAELSLPNKLFEYLMAGLVVVAPRLPALSQLVDGERVGLLFEPSRPDDLARALETLAADRQTLLELRHRARDLAVARLNAEAQQPALLAAWAIE